MAERTAPRLWLHRAIFALTGFGILVVLLVPVDLRPRNWAGPDLLLVITLVWVARKPAFLPMPFVAVMFLFADFFLMRPPGLWAALVVMSTEAVRRRHRDFRNMPFLAEWGSISAAIVMITFANRLVLLLLGTPVAPLGLSVLQLLATILAYPVVVVIAHFLFGIRRVAPGEMDERGNRL